MGVIVWCRERWRGRDTKYTGSRKQIGTFPPPRLEGKRIFSVVDKKVVSSPIERLLWIGADYSATSHEL